MSQETYAGLDVSDKTTHIHIVDKEGGFVWRGVVPSDPEAMRRCLVKQAPHLKQAVLETGPLSSFLFHGLDTRGVPVVCVCARHAKRVLAARANKTDALDAEGLAHLARTGWYKRVHMKDPETHLDRATLRVRDTLIKSHRVASGQLRGLLKLFGLKLGAVTTPGKRRERLARLLAGEADLRRILTPLIHMIEALEDELAVMNKQLKARAQADPVVKRLMTAPGVGPITALTFKTSIEDPGRFSRIADVGAYAGLVPRRYQSGARDTQGSISKAGDRTLRQALYEAANVVIARLRRDCALKRWADGLQDSKGAKRARVAVARKLACLLLSLWRSEADFRWA